MRQRFATVPTTYMLEDLNDVQVAGLFYEPEMVLVRGKGKDTEYHVEKNTGTQNQERTKTSAHQMERISKFIQLMGTSN